MGHPIASASRYEPVSRRRFLRLCALTGAGALLAACQPAPAAAPTSAPAKPTEAPKPAAPATASPAAAASPATSPSPAASPVASPAAGPASQAPATVTLASKIAVRAVSSQQKSQEAFKVIERWGDELKQRSNGMIEVTLEGPEAIPGGEKDALEGLRTLGVYDAIHVTTTILSTVEPKYGLTDLPFIFKDRDFAYRVVDGKIGQTLDDALTTTAKARPLMRTYGLMRHVNLRNKPINELADFRGVKIRTIQADIPLRTFQLVGANPVPMAFTEVYTALQTGVLDAWEAPLDAIFALKMHEVAKFVSLTGHQYVDVVLVMNDDFFRKAPKDVQDLFMATARSLTPQHRQNMTETEQKAIKDLEGAGVKINDIANKKPLQDAVSPIYDDVGRRAGMLDLINEVRSMS